MYIQQLFQVTPINTKSNVLLCEVIMEKIVPHLSNNQIAASLEGKYLTIQILTILLLSNLTRKEDKHLLVKKIHLYLQQYKICYLDKGVLLSVMLYHLFDENLQIKQK